MQNTKAVSFYVPVRICRALGFYCSLLQKKERKIIELIFRSAMGLYPMHGSSLPIRLLNLQREEKLLKEKKCRLIVQLPANLVDKMRAEEEIWERKSVILTLTTLLRIRSNKFFETAIRDVVELLG